MKVALAFSGQGAQYVGMGKDLFEEYSQVQELYNQVNEYSGLNISNISFNGPKEELVNTVNAQLSILTHSIACFEVLKNSNIKIEGALGFSLGEYSALVASGVVSFKDCVAIVLERAKLMDDAIKTKESGMIAVMGVNYDDLMDKISNNAQISNYNTLNQIVIGGYSKNLEKIDFSDTKHVKLDVSGAFHTSILDEASNKFKQVLENYSFNIPSIKLVSNYTGNYYDKVTSEILSKQMNNTVWFYKNVEVMINDGFDTFIELGPNRVLSSFIKTISRELGVKVTVLNVEDVKSLEKTLKKMEENNA